jgi:pimeloyl-ACP methyl ester carboxylesterase
VRTIPQIGAILLVAILVGCGAPGKGPVVIFLDGAGWYSSGGSIEGGLRDAGFKGQVQVFSWSTFLGPATDHFLAANSKIVAGRLANKIARWREANPSDSINLMGLSAGNAVILSALEELKGTDEVDNVVLLSPTVSGERSLTKIMSHVRRNLYATCSPHDGIVNSLTMNADGRSGPPAGRIGFKLPVHPTEGTRAAYSRIINLHWQPSYVGFDWTGSHTSVTSRRFIASVIAPRILTGEPYPLDRPIIQVAEAGQ